MKPLSIIATATMTLVTITTPSMAQQGCVPFDTAMKKYNVTEKNELFSFCDEGMRYSYFKLDTPVQGKKYLLLLAGGQENTNKVCAYEEELVSDADYKRAKASFKAGNDDGPSSLKKVCWH